MKVKLEQALFFRFLGKPMHLLIHHFKSPLNYQKEKSNVPPSYNNHYCCYYVTKSYLLQSIYLIISIYKG